MKCFDVLWSHLWRYCYYMSVADPGKGPGGPTPHPPPYFWTKREKNFSQTGPPNPNPYLRVWMTSSPPIWGSWSTTACTGIQFILHGLFNLYLDILHVGIIWGHSRPSFNRLHCSHNLIPFSNLCEAALRSLFCALKDATNYRSAFQVSLHSNWQINNDFLTGLSWHTLKSWAQLFEGCLGLTRV